ncbi:FixH family protein [Neobacillus jeddahensis]|uniref:FixH family protein n=1 Tax=Neobacillus jeddahensis TaxID=1461580 RepID=UPI00059144F4|nr:FixH family protein [Neobacillus jeddahensis]
MKKRIVSALMLLLVLILAGCSNGPEYNVKFTKDVYFQKDTELPFEIKVTENKKAVTGLNASVEFAMTEMDHGTYKVKLTEGKDGTYSGKVALQMSGKYEAAFTFEKDGEKSEKIIDVQVTKPKGVAKINGDWITDEDVAFYQLINQLQLAINREAAKQNYSGAQLQEELSYLESQEKANADKNQLLTQIIRLRSMAMLADEKGHQATESEIAAAVDKVRAQYNQYAGTKQLISSYGEDQFWATEKEQYKLIVLSQKVQQDLIAQVKKENPSVGEQEIIYLAQQKYEELLVSQVNSLTIEIL